MSVGLSIFLSAIFLGTVALYIFTHQSRFLWAAFMLFGLVALYVSTNDRWDWKKLVRKTILWLIVATVVLVTAGGLGFGVYIWNMSRPKVQDRIWGIPLGATTADVKFIKGQPSTTEGDVWTYRYKAGEAGMDCCYVRFSEDKVDLVACAHEGFPDEELQGIQLRHSTPDDVRKKFGEPTEVRTEWDNLGRSFWYAKYHVVFWMQQNTVNMLGVYDPRTRHLSIAEPPGAAPLPAAPAPVTEKKAEPVQELKHPDVIFVPTPPEVVAKMLELAKVTKDDVVYDLGCGDGRIVVAAAKLGAKTYGFDVDPRRIKESNENVEKNAVGNLATIELKDIFTLDLSPASVITLYLLPSLNVKMIPQLEKLKPGCRIVSHDFDMRAVKPDQVVQVTSDDGSEHTVYLWTTPLKKEQEESRQ